LNVLRRSGTTLALQVLQLASAGGSAVVLTRATGAEGLGRYTLLGLVAYITTLAAGVGISWSAIHHVGAGKHELRGIVSTVLGAALLSTLLAEAAAGVAFLLTAHTYFNAVTPPQLGLTLAAISLLPLNTATASLLLGTNRPALYASLNLVQFGVAFIIQLFLAAAGVLSATSALAGWVIGIALSLSLGMAQLSRHSALGLRIRRDILRDLAGFGFKGYLANVATFFNYRIDSLMLNGFLGVAAVGYYSVAVAIAETIWYIANATSLVIFPLVSTVGRAEADRLTPKVCRNTLLATLVSAAVLALAARPLVSIVFTPAMAPALQPLWLLLPGTVALSVGKVIASYLSGIGKPGYATWISGANVAMTVSLDLLLIPRFGIAGAAVASSIVYISLTAVSILVFMRESGRSLLETILPQREDVRDYVSLLGRLRGGRAAS
jgi:stage V sporulation protein B